MIKYVTNIIHLPS